MQLDCALDVLHALHLRGPPDYFYDLVSPFLARYDRVNFEWRGLAYTRHRFDRPSPAHDIDHSAHPSSQKRVHEVYIFFIL